jgi:hypothetical protein
MKSLSMKSLTGAALLGLAVVASNPSVAADSKAADALMKMDTNHDGKVTKDEYLAAMAAMFDKIAGAKGYIMAAEADMMMKESIRVWTPAY